MAEPIVKAERVELTFGSGQAAVRAVRGVDLELRPGDRLLVMGPSGSGKTSLLSMLGGLLTPTAGRILLAGEDLCTRGPRERARLRLERFGFVFQDFNLLTAPNARENVEIPLRLAGMGRRDAAHRAAELLRRLGLAARQTHRPRDLSGGEKQRVAIARALANHPEVVLADEPTANLDSETGHQIAEILCQLGTDEGKAIVIVSHDERLADIASRIAWIEDGTLSEQPGTRTRSRSRERTVRAHARPASSRDA